MKPEATRGAPPKRGATASAIINVRVDADRKNHYTRFAKKRRTGDKTLAGLVIETLDAATGYREGTNGMDEGRRTQDSAHTTDHL